MLSELSFFPSDSGPSGEVASLAAVFSHGVWFFLAPPRSHEFVDDALVELVSQAYRTVADFTGRLTIVWEILKYLQNWKQRRPSDKQNLNCPTWAGCDQQERFPGQSNPPQ